MTGIVLGAFLGLLLAGGVLLAVRAAPPMRPIRLADRIAPYLGDTPPPSKLLARPTATSAPFAVVRRLFGPAIGDAVGFLDRVVGGSASVRRRLGGLGTGGTVEEFRIEQVVWGVIGAFRSSGFGDAEPPGAGLGLDELDAAPGDPLQGDGSAVHLLPSDR